MAAATAVKERPILFSGEMVKAILDGRKTQTRRIVKPQPPHYINELHGGELSKRAPYRLECSETGNLCGSGFQDDNDTFYKNPYGMPGDRLWVRETWMPFDSDHLPPEFAYRASTTIDGDECRRDYIKCGRDYRWRPSIHMPRKASRITLEITEVRVERLQSISQEDAKAEGMEPGCHTCGENCIYTGGCGCCLPDYRDSLAYTWMKCYGDDSWHANPWVWAISFRRV